MPVVDGVSFDVSFTTTLPNKVDQRCTKIEGDTSRGQLNYLFESQSYTTTVYNGTYWESQNYRNVVFDEVPTGALLVWLKLNATPAADQMTANLTDASLVDGNLILTYNE